MTFIVVYFSPLMTVNLTMMVMRHFMTLFESGINLIECNPGEI